MLIAGMLCLFVAAASAALGVRALARPASAGGAQQVLRSVAPTRLAAAVMLAAGGVVALSSRPSIGLFVLCITGAVGTVAAGAWQGARYAHGIPTREECGGSGEQPCATCPLSCR